MTFETAIKIARRNITTNGSALLYRQSDGSTREVPLPAGVTPRVALAEARRSAALDMQRALDVRLIATGDAATLKRAAPGAAQRQVPVYRADREILPGATFRRGDGAYMVLGDDNWLAVGGMIEGRLCR